ncbi:AraC family transcriptional regulator [Phenylobacterium sp.]|jgi:AraC family transcriptional regulator|uniref:helix-turn-helix transcriptional regulator n=1 Tax=Phenylobacterium sp. TaxID=1871053 RepID=UPI002F41F5E6
MPGKLGKIHDVAEELARNADAIASLTVLGAGRSVPAHVHANPYLALHMLGGYRECDEDGEAAIGGPAAMFFPAGSEHRMAIGAQGLVTVIVEFDADRLKPILDGRPDPRRARRWIGGEVGRRANRLARAWLSGAGGERCFAMTEAFLRSALGQPSCRPGPPWLDEVEALAAAQDGAGRLDALAARFGVSRPWLVRAYRQWRGEGLGEAVRRRRVAAAAMLLEDPETPLADVAVQAGFCDQSHMNRVFVRLLGRTPGAVRAARLELSSPAVARTPLVNHVA